MYLPGIKTGHSLSLGFANASPNTLFSQIARIPFEAKNLLSIVITFPVLYELFDICTINPTAFLVVQIFCVLIVVANLSLLHAQLETLLVLLSFDNHYRLYRICSQMGAASATIIHPEQYLLIQIHMLSWIHEIQPGT